MLPVETSTEVLVEQATIAAIATPAGRGAVGIVRVSGPRAMEVLHRLSPSVQPKPRVATLVHLQVEGVVVDEALALWFPGPRSFTGEDVVELQTHGSPVLLEVLLRHVLAEPGVRLAQPGEFTRRAVGNGRLDLTRAEAVVDLIDARSESEVRSAAARLEGALAQVLDRLYQPLLQVSAELEGALDFPDEAEGVEQGVRARLESALAEAVELERMAVAGSRLRRGGLVVLYGPVNAGKSTLFNRLAGSSRALVDDEPGTTRDALEANLVLGGMPVTLVDTAGLRADPGRVEALGIAKTRSLIDQADVALLLIPPGATDQSLATWRAEADETKRLEVRGKADLGGTAGLAVSGLSGAGIEALTAAIVERGRFHVPDTVVAHEQHLEAVRVARTALERAVQALEVAPLDVVAGEVGLALAELARLMGLDHSQERLDALFARFCIGK